MSIQKWVTTFLSENLWVGYPPRRPTRRAIASTPYRPSPHRGYNHHHPSPVATIPTHPPQPWISAPLPSLHPGPPCPDPVSIGHWSPRHHPTPIGTWTRWTLRHHPRNSSPLISPCPNWTWRHHPTLIGTCPARTWSTVALNWRHWSWPYFRRRPASMVFAFVKTSGLVYTSPHQHTNTQSLTTIPYTTGTPRVFR